MDDIIKRASERLAGETSRRGFVSMLGKLAAGAAGLITVSAFPHDANAAAFPMLCCTGTPCSTDGCPSGTTVHYTWSCNTIWYCHDCYDSSGGFVCVYASPLG